MISARQGSNLYFYRARYYDAPLGRFLQTDPIGYADQWSLYTYVGNDPLQFTDPSGRLGEGKGWESYFGLPWKGFDRQQKNSATDLSTAATKLTNASDQLAAGNGLSVEAANTIAEFENIMGAGAATIGNLQDTASALNDAVGILRSDEIKADRLSGSVYNNDISPMRAVVGSNTGRPFRMEINRGHSSRTKFDIGHEAIHLARGLWEHGEVGGVIAYSRPGVGPIAAAHLKAFQDLALPDTLRNPDHIMEFVYRVK